MEFEKTFKKYTKELYNRRKELVQRAKKSPLENMIECDFQKDPESMVIHLISSLINNQVKSINKNQWVESKDSEFEFYSGTPQLLPYFKELRKKAWNYYYLIEIMPEIRKRARKKSLETRLTREALARKENLKYRTRPYELEKLNQKDVKKLKEHLPDDLKQFLY